MAISVIKLSLLPLILLASSSIVSAVDFTQWSPPGPGDVRSPCPGLNALANHNILPHTGKNLTLPILSIALASSLNIDPDLSTRIFTLAISAVSPDPSSGSFDLDDLDIHNAIEHDASLSRSDYYVSPTHDNYSFNQSVFDQVLAFYDGMNETCIDVAAKAKYSRLRVEEGEDAELVYGAMQFVLSYGETALYLSTLGDPATGVAQVEFVKILFEEERLPFKEGWRPTANETNMSTLVAMITELYTASGEPQPEGLQAALGFFEVWEHIKNEDFMKAERTFNCLGVP